MSPLAINFEQSSAIYDQTDHSSYNPYEAVADSLYIGELRKTNLKNEFETLKESWISDTLYDSGYERKVNHPSYLEIVSWGEEAIPILIEDMANNREDWFYALTDITGVNPIRKESMGRFDMIVEDWLSWANENNYINVIFG